MYEYYNINLKFRINQFVSWKNLEWEEKKSAHVVLVEFISEVVKDKKNNTRNKIPLRLIKKTCFCL